MAKAFNGEEANTVVVSALPAGLTANHEWGHQKEVVLLPGIGTLRCQDLVRDQVRRLTGEEHGLRVHESWVPTLSWLLNLLCELEQALVCMCNGE